MRFFAANKIVAAGDEGNEYWHSQFEQGMSHRGHRELTQSATEQTLCLAP